MSSQAQVGTTKEWPRTKVSTNQYKHHTLWACQVLNITDTEQMLMHLHYIVVIEIVTSQCSVCSQRQWRHLISNRKLHLSSKNEWQISTVFCCGKKAISLQGTIDNSMVQNQHGRVADLGGAREAPPPYRANISLFSGSFWGKMVKSRLAPPRYRGSTMTDNSNLSAKTATLCRTMKCAVPEVPCRCRLHTHRSLLINEEQT